MVLFIRKVSKDADNELDPEKRQQLGQDLVRNKNWASGSWIPDFTSVFDRFFGKQHLRWRCFYRSALISIFAYSALGLITGAFEVVAVDAQNQNANGDIFWKIYAVMFGVVITVNVVCDYVSLLETRFLLKTALPTWLKIALDVPITVLITLIWLTFITFLLGKDMSLAVVLLIGSDLDAPLILAAWIRVVVATSFTTSIWLWLHGLAQLTIRGLNGAEFVMSWLNVKEKPLRAVGTTINIFVLLIGVVLFPVFAIAG